MYTQFAQQGERFAPMANMQNQDGDKTERQRRIEESGRITKEEITKSESEEKAKYFWQKETVLRLRKSKIVNLLFWILVPMLGIVFCEWVARGTLGPHEKDFGFLDALANNFPSFLITYILLLLLYACLSYLFKNHVGGTVGVGLVCILPAVATYYKLTMRNEPLLPWDLMQIGDLMGIADEVSLSVQTPMVLAGLIFLLLSVLACFLVIPLPNEKKKAHICRFGLALASLGGMAIMIFFVFLSPTAILALGIEEDMWMQDRYYRYNGVLSGFLTNLQMLNIEQPAGYSEQEVAEILQEQTTEPSPFYARSPAAAGMVEEQAPDIIYLMAEGYWDMERLPGIGFDRELTPNFNELAQQAASGWAYTPSYGGGTCDVEFEVLTGFSMEYLPAGSKPYQQYITDDTFSLAWVLKDRGYETVAIHGYGERFWNRDVAYPRLGIDDFISEEDMEGAARRRGLISDQSMVDRTIEELQARSSEDNSVFIHTVSIQNHTTYGPGRYPESEMVSVTQNEANLSDDIVVQLEDCATGMYEMDKALGHLTNYLSTVDKHTIVVFWGDHLNPMSDGYGMFEDSGYIEEGDTQSPQMYQTPLLIWSNQGNTEIDLGTVSTYNISPLMLELFGQEMPAYFEFLNAQMNEYTADSKGVMFFPDGQYTREINEEQESLLYPQSVLQYDLLFGEKYQLQDA